MTGTVRTRPIVKSKEIEIAGVEITQGSSGGYYTAVPTGLPSGTIILSICFGGNWDEWYYFYPNPTGTVIQIVSRKSSPGPIPSVRSPLTIYYI